MRGLMIRKVLSGLVVAGTIAALLSSGTSATAAPQDLKTVPFEVSGELPIYPKALWKNGSSGVNVRKVEARLVQLKVLEKRYLDNEFGTMTRSAVKKFQKAHGIPALGYVDQNTWDQLVKLTHEPTQTELYPPVPVVNDTLSVAS